MLKLCLKARIDNFVECLNKNTVLVNVLSILSQYLKEVENLQIVAPDMLTDWMT